MKGLDTCGVRIALAAVANAHRATTPREAALVKAKIYARGSVHFTIDDLQEETKRLQCTSLPRMSCVSCALHRKWRALPAVRALGWTTSWDLYTVKAAQASGGALNCARNSPMYALVSSSDASTDGGLRR